MENNNRNLLITIILSVLILTLWQIFYMNPRIEADREAARIEAARVEAEKKAAAPAPLNPDGTVAAPAPGAVPGTVPGADGAIQQTREAALAATQRIKIDTPSLEGSLNLVGGRLDDLKLKKYQLTVEPTSPIIELLNPSSLPNGYFAEVGYVGTGDVGTLPQKDTLWTVDGGATTLTPSTPVTLSHTNDKGIVFKRTYTVDADYMFKVTDTVTNGSAAPVSLSEYGRVTRYDKPTTPSIYVLHEGLIGMTGDEGRLQEITYSTIEESKEIAPAKVADGWLGMTDHYWAVSLAPSGKTPFTPLYAYYTDGGRSRYQAQFVTDGVSIPPNTSETFETQIFAGAKVVELINGYQDDLNIREFNLLIDWGWFYFITKPMFWLIDSLYKLLGNFGLAILATTVLVKLVFFPLANKSYKSMARMKVVQPKMLEIRDKYADDKMKQQQAMMELYKTEKINPIAGCWPVLIQIPVFFALYKVLYVTIEMRHAPFYGWIRDLAAPDPTSLFNLFGLIPWTPPAILMLGIWPLIMGVTMFLQMRMNPAPPDPTQAAIFNWMPVVFTFMLAAFPAGLVIYWAWNNLLSIIQQGVIMKQQGAKIELWDNLVGMFRRKPTPAE